MKKGISMFLTIVIILSFVCIMPVCANSEDAAIKARIDELYSLLGNMYFTTDQKSASSSSDRCLNSNVIKADWFIKKFGISNLSTSQFPGSPRCTAEAKSCSGFASFAGWYIFRNANTDNVRINELSKMSYNQANVTNYAKIGDIVSLSGNKYNSAGEHVGTAGHEFIFISADSNGAYVLDSNWGNDCKVTKHYIRYSYCDYFQIGRATNRGDVVTPSVPSEPSEPECSHSYWRDVEAVHPHREYMVCSCGDSYYTGNNGYYTAYEGAHPHKYYYVCEVEDCSYHKSYTGANATTTAYEDEYPYNEYYICPVASCSYHNQPTGNSVLPNNVRISTEKQTVEVNKYILFEFTVENANYWRFIVRKDGTIITNDSVTGKYNYSYSFPEVGDYTIEIQAANDYGYRMHALAMTVIPPQKPSVKMVGDKVTVNRGETINYSFTVSNASYWYFIVKKDGEILRNESMTGKYNCSHTFDEAGEYIVEIQAANNNGWSIYSVKANVLEPIPGKPKLKNFNTNYLVDNVMTLAWDETVNTTHYNIYVDKITSEGNDRIDTIHYANSGITRTYGSGKYRVLLQSTNSTNWKYTNGDWVYFTVAETDTPYFITSVRKSGAIHTVYSEIYNVDATKMVIVTGYKTGVLVDIKSMLCEQGALTTTLEGDIDEIKIMVWDSLSGLMPVCAAEVIPKSEWIIE